MAGIDKIKIGSTTYNISPSWSNNTNKPSTFPPDSHTHSYLPIDGTRAMLGTLTLPINTTGLKFRDDTTWEVGTYYGTADNEALTFYTKNINTSFQSINNYTPGSTDSWQKITPALQIRNNKVIINKQLANGVSSDYNLEVNGTIYASGGTMDGRLNFKNNTWNLVGDDVYIGDYNQGGSLGIKGKNGQTNIGFVNQSNDYYIKLASPGVTANRTITMPDDTGTIALTKNIPTSLPANDVYDWAKASSKPSYSWSEINNKPTTFPPEHHTHNYLPLSGGALTGNLDLSSSSSGIRFTSSTSTAYYVTNIESGSVTLSGMNTANSGTRKTISVNFHDGGKGSGSWYVVATVEGSSSTFPDYVTVGVTNISNSGFTINARKIASSPGGSPNLDVNYVAIKYY